VLARISDVATEIEIVTWLLVLGPVAVWYVRTRRDCLVYESTHSGDSAALTLGGWDQA